MKDGEQIRFVVNRTHDGRPLAGKIRSAWKAFWKMLGWATMWSATHCVTQQQPG
jgi:hypothetical protein